MKGIEEKVCNAKVISLNDQFSETAIVLFP